MAEFMMIMKGNAATDDWQPYIEKLIATGFFRGGSAFGKGLCVTSTGVGEDCIATGYMRFEADSMDDVQSLLDGNPVLETGGAVEIHELIVT